MAEVQEPGAEEPEAYYAKLVAEEAASGEPELLLLSELCAGGTAVDVGANRGVYAYALAAVAHEVHAFEANPDYAEFARRMLGPRARVHAVALSNKRGRAPFYVPIGACSVNSAIGWWGPAIWATTRATCGEPPS